MTPYKVNKNGTLVAKERLIITMIDYFSVIEETFESSHMWNKAKLILLIYYLYQQEIQSRLDYRIGYAKLFSPPEADIKIIKNDFEIIVEKIKAGKAHELSEGDTMYLGAAPKAATSKDRRKQPFSNEPAKPRAFAFKNSYMTYVLNNYIVPGKIHTKQLCKMESNVILKIMLYQRLIHIRIILSKLFVVNFKSNVIKNLKILKQCSRIVYLALREIMQKNLKRLILL